jgi:hypothetical protein
MAKRALLILALVSLTGPFQTPMPMADQVSVHYTEGLLHGFIALKTLQGRTLAVGDVTQTAQGDRVTSKLSIKFKDGSLHEETTFYSQREKFQVIKYHIVQKGPSFKNMLDTTINAATGQITGHYTENDGQEKNLNEHMELGPDLANGMVPTLMENILASGSQITVSMVASTPRPRLVKLAIIPAGEDPVSIGGFRRKAMHFIVKVELGAVAGVVAPLIGKQPPDLNVWILGGEAPVFLRSEGPLYNGGPVWRIELIGPTWSGASTASSRKHP